MKEEKIKLERLHFYSNRAYGGDGEIPTLAEDIKRNGLINPITVIENDKHEEGIYHFDVVAGRRRIQAVTLLGWKDIPCRVLEGDEIDRAEEIAASENINRMAMHPLDEAVIFQKLIESGRPIEELARNNDRSVSEIWQRIQLLGLSDDIKTMFRNGNLSLHAAAMLKSLDEKDQQGFYEKFKDNFYVKQNTEIPISEIRSFLSARLNNKLFKFIVVKECKTCQKRTYYKDKELFPELKYAEDSCLDRDCYLKRWNAVMTAKIKNCKKEFPAHADSAILAVDGTLKKWIGKKPTFNGTQYEARLIGYNNIIWGNDPGKNDEPCIVVELNHNDELTVSAKYWKHQTAASDNQRQSGFVAAVKLLELPKAEAAAAIQAFEENKIKFDSWDLNNKVREKVFWSLIEKRSKQPPGKNEVALYLKNNVFEGMGTTTKEKIFKLFIGEDYSEQSIADVAKLPIETLFWFMAAMKSRTSNLPSIDCLDDKILDKLQDVKEFIAWLGTTKEELKKLYQEEIKALMPKAASPEDIEKTDAKKSAKAKKK
jgi:ParB family chromosome partitioning protein